jgi:hypothetical protein
MAGVEDGGPRLERRGDAVLQGHDDLFWIRPIEDSADDYPRPRVWGETLSAI